MTSMLTWVPSVKVSGGLVSGADLDRLREVRVETGYRSVGSAVLRWQDDGFAMAAAGRFALGKEVVVGGPNRSGKDTTLFEGVVTGFSVEADARGVPELVVHAHDRAVLLTRSTQSRTFLQMTPSDVVQKIAQEHGLQAHVDVTQEKADWRGQLDTPFGVLEHLCDLLGWVWWVQGRTLHVHSRSRVHGTTAKVELGHQLVSFAVQASALVPDEFVVRGWDRRRKAEVVGTASGRGRLVPDAKAFGPLASGPVLGSTSTRHAASDTAVSAASATTMAEAMRDRAAASGVVATGEVLPDSAYLHPGDTLELTGLGPVSASYVVTRVEHVWREVLRTRFTCGERAAVGAPARPTPTTHHGPVVGIVTNNNDPEKAGRVKVSFPTAGEQVESDWARVLSPGGGSSRGLVAVPEVQDEVLVAFEGSDLRQPVVLGGLHSEKAVVPAHEIDGSGKVLGRALTSRLGHVLAVQDGADAATQGFGMTVAGGQHLFRLTKKEAVLQVPEGVPLSIKVGASSSLTFDGKGNVELKGLDITLKATKGLVLDAAVDLKASGLNATVEGKAAVAVKGKATAELSASGITTVRGGLVKVN